MFRYANLFMLALTLLCSAPTAYAEDVSTVVEEVKAMVEKKSSCWKLLRQEERKNTEFLEIDLDWVCGKESVVAYLYQVPSVEAAAKLLYEIITSPVQSLAVAPGAPPTDSYKFGDESYVRAYLLYSRSSYVFFRKGNIVVRIDSGARGSGSHKRILRNAVRFAQLFAERMPPPSNSSNPTP
jgi:hypothetical protein